jgi:hypothetical protein
MFPVPDPQNVNLTVVWTLGLNNIDDPPSSTKSAFDCENDGSLEYAWANRGHAPTFDCNYTTAGNKTAKAWISDNANYPTNASLTDTVEIVVIGAGCDSTCSGFVAPTCVGNCYFYDDFNYAPHCVTCNGWENLLRSPVSNMLWLKDLNGTDYMRLYRSGNQSIQDWEYEGFTFEFDFTQNDDDRTFFMIYDKDVAKTLAYLYWETGILYSIDGVSPYTEVLGNYSYGVQYHIAGVVNYTSDTIEYTYRGTNKTVDFLDSGVTSAGRFSFAWLYTSEVDWFIDNFRITYGSHTNASAPPPTIEDGVDYLTTGNFCAINWSNHDFIDDECGTRGYSMKYELRSLCLLRACFSDSFSYMYAKASANILKTLVIVIALILIAPLFIALLKATRRK